MSANNAKKDEAELLAEKEKEKLQERAVKCLDRLVGVSLKFSKFIKNKLQDVTVNNKENDASNSILTDIFNLKHGNNNILKQLKYFSGGTLHPYQVDGVTWMTVLFENGVNGILADEMGLGKTIQIIALLCHLYERNVLGPHLIIVPLSTLPNWKDEFQRFAPKIPVEVIYGSASERENQGKRIMNDIYSLDGKRVKPVVLTTYQVPMVYTSYFKGIHWQYVIMDEGHRIKNYKARLSKVMRMIPCKNRLLLTGTPLQNNLEELWSLLNYILPKLFSDMENFTSLLFAEDLKDDETILEKEISSNLISKIHKVLETFMLRRLKSDANIDMVPKKEVLVYCPLTEMQKTMYSIVLEKSIEKLKKTNGETIADEIALDLPRAKRKCRMNRSYKDNASIEDYEDMYRIYNDAISFTLPEKKKETHVYRITEDVGSIMLKKVCNHPYLVEFPLDPNSEDKQFLIDENIIKTSGKMMVLDAMLKKLKKKGHKIILFSTLCIMLDIIEEYLIMKNYKYERLDGGYKLEERRKGIDSFNNDPSVTIFLVSTRAGGLGLNLIAADTVIFFDRDWNPQADLQAQARCHRIGQTKPVVVYTLATKNTIDERIISVGNIKRKLEKLVITNVNSVAKDLKSEYNKEKGLQELKKLLASDSDCIKIDANGMIYSDKELEAILDRSDLYEQMKNQKKTIK